MEDKTDREPYSADRWNDKPAFVDTGISRPLTEDEKECLKEDEKEFNEMLERAKQRRTQT